MPACRFEVIRNRLESRLQEKTKFRRIQHLDQRHNHLWVQCQTITRHKGYKIIRVAYALLPCSKS